MALACLLRNAGRTNLYCSGLIKSASFSPSLKNFTTLVAGQQRYAAALNLGIKPITLQLAKPLVRSLKLSAPRLGSRANHATLWKAERILASGLLVILPVAFATSAQITDALLAIMFGLHAHWGIESIVVDYVRPSLYGTVIPKLSVGMVYFLSITCLAGLLNLVYNDIGVVGTIKKFWAIRYKEPEPEPDPKCVKNPKKCPPPKSDKKPADPKGGEPPKGEVKAEKK